MDYLVTLEKYKNSYGKVNILKTVTIGSEIMELSADGDGAERIDETTVKVINSGEILTKL